MTIRNLSTSLALVCFSLGIGCAGEPGDEPEAAASRVPADPSGEPPLAEWQDWLAGEVARVERERPAQVNELRAATPVATRAGHPRFTNAALESPGAAALAAPGAAALAAPGAAALLLDRLSRGTDPAPVRAALAEALPRAGGAYAAVLVGLMAKEPDPEVRVVMVGALRRAAAEPALAGLRAALEDSDPRVRAAAAEVASRRPDGATLADPLLARLADDSAEVQLAATRSLGALGVEAAFPALQGRLKDMSPGTAELRLHSLRALVRIDATRAAGLPELTALRDDPDPKVAAAARRITAD